ncbi:hypothetical protein M406DRAFT_358688 [Cryphonectria parasitica EP155]|uniref:Uncharacterized protein n=1 Tax=Cryphonectria parasitica (strain ATCC 38755 / EP155) TaxID=660469 RepID=A0A9P5CHL7_CRYP1|nr:uncharacterized protein M406DRAFT_358688 [Cryphonectria parasitica EP155]KAF3760038.1 hypothetical protein M406DRAFT_358688 [Cryphonectria parasitica EP155]
MRCSLIPALVGLTTVVTALPQSRHHQIQRTTPPPATQEFTLAIELNETYVPLIAVYNNTADLVLQAGEPGVTSGTPTYTNTSTPDADGYTTSLIFDLSNSADSPPGVYGMAVADLGELYGVASYVYGVINFQEFDFAIDDGSVFHELTAASQDWFACQDSVNGTQGYFLSWGVFSEEGLAPTGCVVTNVIQVFNSTGTVTSRRISR